VSRWSGDEFKTKKALREAVATGEAFKVRVLSLGNEHTVFLSNETLHVLPMKDACYIVAGPVAEMDRKWFAEIMVRNGKVTVK
jgi:hypothetical protein